MIEVNIHAKIINFFISMIFCNIFSDRSVDDVLPLKHKECLYNI